MPSLNLFENQCGDDHESNQFQINSLHKNLLNQERIYIEHYHTTVTWYSAS